MRWQTTQHNASKKTRKNTTKLQTTPKLFTQKTAKPNKTATLSTPQRRTCQHQLKIIP
jgi:hypothetical protein